MWHHLPSPTPSPEPSPGSVRHERSHGAHRAGRQRATLLPHSTGQAASGVPEPGELASSGRQGRGSVPRPAPYLLAREDDFLYGSS